MADGLKDRDTQDYYESMQRMFETKGWKYLTEDLMKLLDAANTLNGIATMEELNIRLGQVDILRKMIAQPAVIDAAYQTLLANDEETA
jgi:hypothetical protein